MLSFFINPIGKHITLMIIESEKRTVIESSVIEKTGNDFEIIPKIFVDLAKKYHIEEIWCIVGPGPFTLMRIITLILNSIAYNATDIRLKSSHYFDLMYGSQDILILEANRHEYLIREIGTPERMIKKEELPIGKYIGFIDENTITGYTLFEPSTEAIIETFREKEYENRLSPLYIKAPNITIGSQKTSPHTAPKMNIS